MIKGVVFDFGGVMTTSTVPMRVVALAAELGIPWSAIASGFDRYRRQYDGGFLSFEEMYDRIWADAGIEVSAADAARIRAADHASWLYRNERTLEWMKALKARGFRIGILTNMAPDFAPRFKEHFADFIALADAMVISGEEGLYKPQRAIYDLLRGRIGLPAEELLFIDDVEDNCEGARAAGWQAVRFESNDQVEGVI